MSSISKLWRKLRNKAYRDGYTEAQLSIEIPFQIWALRKARGWTQAQLAERCGIPQARISHIEQPGRDPLSLRTLYRLASAFDVGLLVQFVSFSESVRREAAFNPETFRVTSFEDDHFEETVHTTRSSEKTFRTFTKEEGHLEKAASVTKSATAAPSRATFWQTQSQTEGQNQAWILVTDNPYDIAIRYPTHSYLRDEVPIALTTLSREETLWPQDEAHRTSL